MSFFADLAAMTEPETDLTGVVTFGVLHCPSCAGPKEFVAYDESQRDPKYAECFECGYRYGERTEVVVDDTGRTVLRRTTILSADLVKEARRRLKQDMVRSFLQAEHLPRDVAAMLPSVGQNGPQTMDTRALRESMRASGMSEEDIERVYGSSDD